MLLVRVCEEKRVREPTKEHRFGRRRRRRRCYAHKRDGKRCNARLRPDYRIENPPNKGRDIQAHTHVCVADFDSSANPRVKYVAVCCRIFALDLFINSFFFGWLLLNVCELERVHYNALLVDDLMGQW